MNEVNNENNNLNTENNVSTPNVEPNVESVSLPNAENISIPSTENEVTKASETVLNIPSTEQVPSTQTPVTSVEPVINTKPKIESIDNLASAPEVTESQEEVSTLSTSEPNGETHTNELSEFSDLREKKTKKTLITSAIIFVVIIASLFGVYFLYLTPQSYFSKTLENTSTFARTFFDNSVSIYGKDYNTLLGDYTTTITLEQNSNKISLNLNGNLGYDKKENNTYLTGELKDSNSKLLDFNLFIDKTNKLYFNSKDIFDKTIFTDINEAINEINPDNNINYSQLTKDLTNITDSISYLSNKIVNSYKDNYESDKLKKNIENKKIVNKKVLTMKITNEMTSEELKTVLSKILDDLIKDEKSLEAISVIVNEDTNSKVTTSDVKGLLTNVKDSIKENTEDKKVKMIINYSILSKEFVYAEIQIDNDDPIIIKQEDGIYYMTFEESSGSDKTKIDIQYNSKDEDYTIIFSENEQEITINAKTKKVSDKEYKYNMSVKSNISSINLTYDIVTTIKLDEKLENFDTTNAINVNSLTKEEQMKITTKVYSILLGSSNIITN